MKQQVNVDGYDDERANLPGANSVLCSGINTDADT